MTNRTEAGWQKPAGTGGQRALHRPETSAAAVLSAYDEPLQVQEFPVPEVRPGGVVVRVIVATMCGTDVHMAKGAYAAAGLSRLPLIMGHEIVGRVVDPGERDTDSIGEPLHRGDLIAWSYAWCGQCYWCNVAKQPTLCPRGRSYGWGPADAFPHLTGGFSEYAYVMPECKIVKVPEDLDPAVAATTTCAFRTIVHGYEAIGGVDPLDHVVIQGSGAVGLFALAYALVSGARRVIVIGAPAARLALAREWGAHEVVSVEDTGIDERKELVLSATGGRGADLVLDCAGTRSALPEGLGLLRRGGRYLVIGQSDPRPVPLPTNTFNVNQLTIAGTVSADISHYFRALRFASDHQRRFSFDALLGERYPLTGVDQALAAIASGAEIRPVIEPRR